MHTPLSTKTLKSALEKVGESSDGNLYLIVSEHFEQIQQQLKKGHTVASLARAISDSGFHINRHKLGYYIKKAQRNSIGLEAKESPLPCTTPPAPQMVPPKKTKPIDEYRESQHRIQAVALDPKKDETEENYLPEQVSSKKYITVNGETLDVTKMNIDDYIHTAKKYPRGEKIPPELKSIVRQENLVRNHYEEALKNYGNAIQEWKKAQRLDHSNT